MTLLKDLLISQVMAVAYDASRIAILKDYADHIWSVESDAYVILEHLTENNEEKELSDYGMLLWGNLNYNYNEATMGYHDNNKSDFGSISYKQRSWNDPHLSRLYGKSR
ncbi:MAG: hypothetical protein U5K00_10555 [Melioribacteraceae bacterium]|nr:hypothetical protein [Melioribacteraceae bacterium]